MKAAGVAPDAISYTSAVGALGRAREWEKALGLWTTMGVEGVAIDDLALATLLRALEGGGQWQIALDVFEAVLSSPDAGGVCTSTVFSAVLAACAAGAQADTALGYVSRMRSMGVVPSAACYHQVCAAHAAQQDWRGALAVWQGTAPPALLTAMAQAVTQSRLTSHPSGPELSAPADSRT